MFLKSCRELHFGFKLLFLFWKVLWGPFPRVIVFVNGGRSVTTNEPIQAHDFIEIHAATKTRIYSKCAPLYENGLSIRDISAQTGIAKTTVRETLVNGGMALRNPLNGNAKKLNSKKVKRGGSTPYGWAYLDGKLVIDPKEQLVVRQIIKLHKNEKSYRAIANHLNANKVPTRMRGFWRPSTIKSIITRHNEELKNGGSNE